MPSIVVSDAISGVVPGTSVRFAAANVGVGEVSITAPGGVLLWAMAANGVFSGAVTLPTIEGLGLTWTRLNSIWNGANHRLTIWIAKTTQEVSGAVTFTAPGGAGTELLICSVTPFSGVDLDNPIVQAVYDPTPRSHGFTTPPLANPVAERGAVISVVNLVPATGADVSVNAPFTLLFSEFTSFILSFLRLSLGFQQYNNVTSATWGGVAGSIVGYAQVELRAVGVGEVVRGIVPDTYQAFETATPGEVVTLHVGTNPSVEDTKNPVDPVDVREVVTIQGNFRIDAAENAAPAEGIFTALSAREIVVADIPAADNEYVEVDLSAPFARFDNIGEELLPQEYVALEFGLLLVAAVDDSAEPTEAVTVELGGASAGDYAADSVQPGEFVLVALGTGALSVNVFDDAPPTDAVLVLVNVVVLVSDAITPTEFVEFDYPNIGATVYDQAQTKGGLRVLTDDAVTSPGASHVTALVAPTVDTELLLFVVSTVSAAPAATPTIAGLGLTWVEKATVLYSTDARRTTLFAAKSIGGSGALTIDFGGQNQLAVAYSLVEVAVPVGADPVLQVATAAVAAGTVVTPTLGPATGDSVILAATGTNVPGGTAITEDTGFDELSDIFTVISVARVAVQARYANDDVAPTFTRSFGGDATWGAIAVEIAVAYPERVEIKLPLIVTDAAPATDVPAVVIPLSISVFDDNTFPPLVPPPMPATGIARDYVEVLEGLGMGLGLPVLAADDLTVGEEALIGLAIPVRVWDDTPAVDVIDTDAVTINPVLVGFDGVVVDALAPTDVVILVGTAIVMAVDALTPTDVAQAGLLLQVVASDDVPPVDVAELGSSIQPRVSDDIPHDESVAALVSVLLAEVFDAVAEDDAVLAGIPMALAVVDVPEEGAVGERRHVSIPRFYEDLRLINDAALVSAAGTATLKVGTQADATLGLSSKVADPGLLTSGAGDEGIEG